MSRHVALPPDQQYGILETFSANEADNINQVTKILVASPPISGHDGQAGNIYDMAEEFEYSNCILENSFELEKVSSDEVKVYTGQCDINGVYISIQEIRTMDTNNADYYLDGVKPTVSGVLYIMVKYNPIISDPDAYIGLIKKSIYTALSDSAKTKYCFIGAVDATLTGSTVTDIDVYYYDPDSPEQSRPYPQEFCDGGFLDTPDEYLL